MIPALIAMGVIGLALAQGRKLKKEKMDKNMQAFLLMIRKGEGTLGDSGYRKLVGGSYFDSFVDHPRKMITIQTAKGPINSNAAGAYQILSTSWDETHKGKPFTPAWQDDWAINKLKSLGAYADIENGNIKSAINKAKGTWASLPGSPYGQPTQALSDALSFYKNNGGLTIT